jgi:vitamin B12 transporter
VLTAAAVLSTGRAQESPVADPSAAAEPVELAEFVLEDTRVANPLPASSFAAPVSSLRFEPRVDLQSRNFGEAQGDISVRGGVFEGTAVTLGGIAVFDPQTGHYAAEIPAPAAMLAATEVLTGVDHAFGGANATAGTISYNWRPIEDRGEVAAAVGNGSLNRQSLYIGRVLQSGAPGHPRIAVDGEIARSEAMGTIKDGDHRFLRLAGRVEMGGRGAKTSLFLGHQRKFFGWPNLYTPFGVAETERLETTLAMVSHEIIRDDVRLQLGGFFRRNHDDYEFDRYRPGLFNPYEHTTHAGGAAASLTLAAAGWTWTTRAYLAADSIESTSLTSGRFDSRIYRRVAVMGSRRFGARQGQVQTRFGLVFDDTNREESALSPLAEIAWSPNGSQGRWRWFAQVAQSTRVPGYTALNSPATSGLFRGNPDLGRERSGNLEAGIQARASDWSFHAAAFVRRDDPMVDWTFSQGTPNARSASLVEMRTSGIEVVASRSWRVAEVIAGYTWLEKDANYGGSVVDASFYALNFPRHRFTLALTARLGGGFEVRSDNEYRVQEENLLRVRGGDSAVLSSLGLYWLPPRVRGLELSIVADNLWASAFQELPAVPAPGRQVTLGLVRRW